MSRDPAWVFVYRPYVHPDGIRHDTGFKYCRITDRRAPLDRKAPYDPHAAWERAAQHAGNFLFNRERQVEFLAGRMDRPPIVVAPYDAELLGHWWFEGPMFLDFLFRKMQYDQDTVVPITPSEYLARHPTNQVATPCASSWGSKGYAEDLEERDNLFPISITGSTPSRGARSRSRTGR